jgi:eukaryotic-like serine/threonine-protein kinase
VTTITELPPPRTDVREAAAEYATAMQAFHDDNFNKALSSWAKAATLDPKMAMAHLHSSLMLSVYNVPAIRRAVYEKALGVRAGLSERDLGLLEALQPFLQPATQDPGEADRRLQALSSRYPGDVELSTIRAMLHYATAAALAPAMQTLELDPGDAQSYELLGDTYSSLGKYAEAEEALKRCSKFSPDSADCYGWLSMAELADGKCEDAERDARKAADREAFWNFALLFAMPSLGRSEAVIGETAQRLVPAIPPLAAPEAYAQGIKVRMAILAGDFTRAAAETKREAALIAGNPALSSSYLRHLQVLDHQIEIALETGDDGSVRKLVDDFTAHRDAWDTEVALAHGIDLSLAFERLALGASKAPPESFEGRRKVWIQQQLFAGADRAEAWNYAYAAAALTPAEAQGALDVMGEYGPPTPAPVNDYDLSGRTGSPEGELGRIDLLVGRTDEAVEHLRRAVAACDLYTSTIDHVRAWLNLGRALELKPDTKGACDAYGKVLVQWGHAKPRSVTAEAARTRRKALACSD